MKALSRTHNAMILILLVACMIATRFKHFGDAMHLPDASMAVLFIGGIYLRRHLAFAGFVTLAVLVDWISVNYAGVSDFCITPAYAFLLPAYAVLWYGGRACGVGRSFFGSLAFGFVAACLSFAISNGGFYWLGGRYANPHVAEYVARLWQWGPLFVRTTMAYLVVALLVRNAVAYLVKSGGTMETSSGVHVATEVAPTDKQGGR
ncbi:hypothetical protein [Dyella sp. GSA-30]|uniref:hypothetical protein n=1 Tax=Dyella sp. GSA-30 TaxID=2994496 RepID=UPI0024937576|nr:hypothetical protein [Dyella sp. GSA-30]BDU23116.1 hypothetical protein DYGSA30_45730 [Dyella sp. GSA-30]